MLFHDVTLTCTGQIYSRHRHDSATLAPEQRREMAIRANRLRWERK